MPVNMFRAKTVVLGDPGVGKTAFVHMYTSDGREFPKNYNMETLGADLQVKRCPLPETSDIVEMLIYDCGGHDLYVDHLTQFWDQPEMLLLVYDVCVEGSLQAVSDWLRVASSAQWAGGRSSPVSTVLFANKTDIGRRRVVTEEAGAQLAENLGLHYMEGSAKENVNVQEAFSWLAQQFWLERTGLQDGVRPRYSSTHKSVLRSSLSNSSLK